MSVVALKTHRGQDLSQNVVITEEVMNQIRLRIYDWHPFELGVLCGVSASCIRSIRSGRTKWPRPITFAALLKVLDIELRLYDSPTGRRLV